MCLYLRSAVSKLHQASTLTSHVFICLQIYFLVLSCKPQQRPRQSSCIGLYIPITYLSYIVFCTELYIHIMTYKYKTGLPNLGTTELWVGSFLVRKCAALRGRGAGWHLWALLLRDTCCSSLSSSCGHQDCLQTWLSISGAGSKIFFSLELLLKRKEDCLPQNILLLFVYFIIFELFVSTLPHDAIH